jgi:hypothetical protein
VIGLAIWWEGEKLQESQAVLGIYRDYQPPVLRLENLI